MSFFVRERPSNEKHYKYIFGERALFSPKKTGFTFSEVLKDFSKFYDLPYNERLKIAEKYDISTFYIFLDKEKELIFGVDFAKSSEVEENLREVLKCTPKDIFDFVPKGEHTKRYFEEYQKKYFEEDEEIIFFEWFLKRFKNNSFDFEQYLIDYWNQMRIDNFPEEYLTKTISDLKSQIEEGILKNSDNYFKGENRFFLFGAEKFKRGTEMPFNGYLLELYFYWRATAKPAYFNESLNYLVNGYQRAKFYKFLIEQQKRLLKGEDITKPYEVEEKENEEIKTTLSSTEIWLIEFFETGDINFSFPKHQTKLNHAKIVAEKYGFAVDSDSLDKYKKYAEQIIDKKHKFASNQRKPKFKNLRNVKTYFESKEKKEQAKKVNDFIELNYSDFT